MRLIIKQNISWLDETYLSQYYRIQMAGQKRWVAAVAAAVADSVVPKSKPDQRAT
jgi:hypothetical protein